MLKVGTFAKKSYIIFVNYINLMFDVEDWQSIECFMDNSSLIGQRIFLGGCLYQITDGNIGKNTVSLKNVLTGNYARHYNGNIENHQLISEEIFLFDSSFYPEEEDDCIRLYCSNAGLEEYCISDISGQVSIKEKILCDKEGILSKFKIIDVNSIPVKNHIIPQDNNIKVIAFGSSSAEIFDYIFGDNYDYYPFWASGWSSRGLRNVEKHISPYKKYLENLSSESIIMLHFGSVDIDFNLQFKINQTGFYKTEIFINEMVEGILGFRKYLQDNFNLYNIYPVFTAPTVDLEPEYWVCQFGFYPLCSKMRARMLWDFSMKLSSFMPVINCLPDLVESIDNPVCDKKYMRDYPDHHIDFIKAQNIIYNKLKVIPNILPQAVKKEKKLYEHLIYDVYNVVTLNQPRPRTCR